MLGVDEVVRRVKLLRRGDDGAGSPSSGPTKRGREHGAAPESQGAHKRRQPAQSPGETGRGNAAGSPSVEKDGNTLVHMREDTEPSRLDQLGTIIEQVKIQKRPRRGN